MKFIQEKDKLHILINLNCTQQPHINRHQLTNLKLIFHVWNQRLLDGHPEFSLTLSDQQFLFEQGSVGLNLLRISRCGEKTKENLAAWSEGTELTRVLYGGGNRVNKT